MDSNAQCYDICGVCQSRKGANFLYNEISESLTKSQGVLISTKFSVHTITLQVFLTCQLTTLSQRYNQIDGELKYNHRILQHKFPYLGVGKSLMLLFNGHQLLTLIFQLTLPCFTSMQFEAVYNLTILNSMLYLLAKKRKLAIMQFCCINPDCLAFDDGIVVSGFLDKDGNLPVCNFCYTSLQKLSLATTSEYTCIILC